MAKWTIRAVLVLVVCPTHLAAEHPAREELQRQLLMTRRSNYEENCYGGIWRFEPDSREYRRLRPFHASYGSPIWGFDGGDGFLSAHGDTLTYRTWPYLIDFDVFSWRMIRRRPTSTAPEEEGWVVQGPTLIAEEAEPLGLEPGSYGIPRCVLHILASGGEFPIQCEPWAFPGAIEPDKQGTDAVILWREPPPEDSATEHFMSLEPFDWGFYHGVPPCLSFDWARHGLWRCRPRGAVLYPLVGGRLGDPVIEFDLTDPPFDIDDLEVERLLYLPASDMLFGTGLSFDLDHEDRFFFSVDADTHEVQLLGEWYGVREKGAPAALGGLGQPPREHVQLLPIVATGPGAKQTHWSTELWFFNPSSETMRVRVRRVSRPNDTKEIELSAHESRRVADAMAWIGGGPEGDGTVHEALVVSSSYRWGEQVVVAGGVSTPGAGGTFGHAVPAVPGRVGYSNHLTHLRNTVPTFLLYSPGLLVSHLDLDLRESNRYRYNIGVVNDLDSPLALRLIWAYHDWHDQEVGWARPEATEVELTVPAHHVEVLALEQLFPAEIRERWAPRIALVGDHAAAVWLSMVDNLTGDATFIPFTSFEYLNPSDEDRFVIPVAAHGAGVGDALWQTDLYGHEERGGPVHAVYHPTSRDADCGGGVPLGGIEQPLTGEMGMPLSEWNQTLRDAGVGDLYDDRYAAGFRAVFEDVVRLFAPCSAEEDTKGALELAAGSWSAGFSRTYTTRDDGGTYGGMLPLYPYKGWPVQHFAGIELGAERRVNVGLFNGNPNVAVIYHLLLYAVDGDLAAERILALGPYDSIQRRLEHLFGMHVGELPTGTYGLSVVPLDDDERGVEGRSWAYVSLVDELTGDPTNWW